MHHVVDIVGGGPAEGRHVLLAHQGVGDILGAKVELDDGTRQHGPFRKRELLGELSGGNVAHHHFDRQHLDLMDELFPHVEAPHEIRRYADLCQADPGGILEVLDEEARARPFEEVLFPAFVNTPATSHVMVPVPDVCCDEPLPTLKVLPLQHNGLCPQEGPAGIS